MNDILTPDQWLHNGIDHTNAGVYMLAAMSPEGITVSDCIMHLNTSRNTAYKYLNQLTEACVLIRHNEGGNHPSRWYLYK